MNEKKQDLPYNRQHIITHSIEMDRRVSNEPFNVSVKLFFSDSFDIDYVTEVYLKPGTYFYRFKIDVSGTETFGCGGI